MTKAAIKREESQARLNYPEREQARPKVNDDYFIGFHAAKVGNKVKSGKERMKKYREKNKKWDKHMYS